MFISKGKTKVITSGPQKDTVLLETQDVLTGGDAAKRETIGGIGVHKTTQAANVFSLLNKRGLPTAFIERASPNTLLCHQCEMLPLELVVRRYAWGSYLQRHPEYKQEKDVAYRFDDPVWEAFHKWSVVGSPITNTPYQIDEEKARKSDFYATAPGKRASTPIRTSRPRTGSGCSTRPRRRRLSQSRS